MSFTLHLQDIDNIIFESGNQEYETDESGTKELSLSYNHHIVGGWYKELSFDGFRIGYGKNELSKQTRLLFDFEGETVEMHFTLQGISKTKVQNIQDLSMNNNSHNIFYCNSLEGKVDWFSNNMFIFEVNLSPSFFAKYLPDDKTFENFKKQIQKKETGMMSDKGGYPITSKMYMVIQQIMNCNLKSTFRKLFIESKILELLMLQMEQIQSYKTPFKKNEKITASSIDKMYYAKELISQKIDNPLSLSELSTILNTNECTLKKDFKATFNTTVFGYIKELKMKKAKSILLDSNYTISEVSDMIGYKNPQHFTTAFKKYYGFVPSKLRF